MRDRFLAYIEQHKLCTTTDKLLLAVSGGIDSMTMLHLFRAAGYAHLGVAHANFQLRGNESDQDEQFVRDYCSENNLPFFSRAFDTKNYARQNGISVQMAARELRYNWFAELVEKENFSAVATAHTLTDAAETFLMNFLHGAPAERLTGIPVKHNRIIRPLLFATRIEIQNYAQEQHLTWREDSSNASDVYLRNYIRHHLSPHFEQINPSWEANAAHTMEKITGTLQLQQLGLEVLKNKFVQTTHRDIIISKEIFQQHVHPYILYKLIEPYGFNYAVCNNILSVIHGQPGKKFLSATHQLVVDRNALLISIRQETPEEVLIEKGQQQAERGNLQLSIDSAATSERPENPSTAVLDAAKLVFPLRWRPWRPGDYFYPLGMKHRKKISDFLIDSKIPLPEKERLTVLETNGDIAWVVGYRIDDRFKITAGTNSAIRFTVRTHFT